MPKLAGIFFIMVSKLYLWLTEKKNTHPRMMYSLGCVQLELDLQRKKNLQMLHLVASRETMVPLQQKVVVQTQ